MKQLITLICTLALLCAMPAVHAQEHHHDDGAATAASLATPAPAMSTGEVLKVDKHAGKITLRHGPLANLGMAGMTMPFSVAAPAMLDQVRPGDKVRFVADDPNDTLTIVKLELAQ